MKLNNKIPWSRKSVTNFYSSNRNKISDLYKSEKFLLKKIKKKSIKSIVDFGCATGGFYNIFKEIFNYNIVYTGIDFNNQMLNLANKYKIKTERKKFMLSNTLPKRVHKHDLIFTTGIMLSIPQINYKKLINEFFKKSNKYIFFDFRVNEKKNLQLKMDLSIKYPDDKKNIDNYYVIKLEDLLSLLKTKFLKENLNLFLYIDLVKNPKNFLNSKNQIYFLSILIEKKGKKKINVYGPNIRIKNKILNFFIDRNYEK